MNTIKTYTIDLDKKPERRWRKVINDHKENFADVEREIDLILKGAGALGGLAKFMTGAFNTFGSIMHKRELEGISVLSGVPMNKLILMQICYEMFSACTSLVIRGKDRNYHFRTMDWEMDFLKNMTINVTFVKGGQELFKATTWAGYVGVATGVNANYSLALNYRRSNGTLIGNVFRTMGMKWPSGYLIRYIFENNWSANKAYQSLSSYKLISPCYVTFCPSKGNAKVIVRDCRKAIDEKTAETNGYLIQTNHDTLNDDINTMWSFERYKKAKSIIKSNYNFDNGVCDNVNRKNILQNFHVKPIINAHTIHSTLMIPGDFSLESYVVSDHRYVDGNFDKLMKMV
jgi:acid ceramidase